MKKKSLQIVTALFFLASILIFSTNQLSAYQQSGSCHTGDPSPCNDAGCPDTTSDPCSYMLCDDDYGTELCMKGVVIID